MDYLRNAIHKCTHAYGRVWDGHLIPKEIIALRDFGVGLKTHDIESAVHRKRTGINNGYWIRFDVPIQIEERLKERL
jgi:hypothetical protein